MHEFINQTTTFISSSAPGGEFSVILANRYITITKILFFNPNCEVHDATCILLDLHCGLTSLSISW
jgi:hypothetical protein